MGRRKGTDTSPGVELDSEWDSDLSTHFAYSNLPSPPVIVLLLFLSDF